MIKLLLLIGLMIPSVFAEEEDTLYFRVKNIVELESRTEEATLPVQRFSLGVFHDFKLDTRDTTDLTVPFEIRSEEYVDDSIQTNYPKMCGDLDLKNAYMTCLLAQNRLRTAVERNTWLRQLGRNMQAIVSGYEMGIDGYPAKPIDVITRFSSITHLWRAANDPFVEPFLEVLTRARPWPDGKEDDIKDKAKEIVDMLKGMIRTWEAEADDATEKKDKDALISAIHRYRHGVRYVIEREGSCGDPPALLPIPENLWLDKRVCALEEILKELSDIIQTVPADVGNDEHILYPSFIDKENNIYIWIRYDDVGLQWYIPLEPVQAALYPPEFGNCLESGATPTLCIKRYTNFMIRGGKYPNKQGEDERNDQPALGTLGSGGGGNGGDEDEDLNDHAVVPEPKEGDGICSHPFSKRGYLCRRIEYEACDLTKEQEDELKAAGTGGIVLTRCQPERFKDDVARKVSSSNICGIGGWKETVQENLVEDTPEEQPDMRPNKCAACAVDVVCKEECIEGNNTIATTALFPENGVTKICIPSNPPIKSQIYYLLAHELIHAQQNCNDSTIQKLERIGLLDENTKDPGACCAAEREAYLVQCKLYAIDGILDKAGVTIDQCASAYANFSCKAHEDEDEDGDEEDDEVLEDDYVCTNDGIDPQLVAKAIVTALKEITPTLNLPTSCAKALKHPRIKAIYNSFPLSCKPGCQTKYQNTIGNNFCYTGQCLEETREWARDIPGRMSLTTVDQGFPWDSCERPDPNLGDFEAPPALTAPRFPIYRPARMLQELDIALCQINLLPARTPPIICGFEAVKRIGLPPLTLIQSVDDLALQPEQYDRTGLSIQYAASAIGSRVATDMFTQYLRTGSRQFTDLLNMMYHILDGVANLEFPSMMCPRYADENFSCQDLQRTQ